MANWGRPPVADQDGMSVMLTVGPLSNKRVRVLSNMSKETIVISKVQFIKP